MKKSLIYLVCRQNYSSTCVIGFSWDLIFRCSSLKMSGKGIVLFMDFISFLCGNCRWKTSLFRLLSTWIFVFISRVYREESLSQKKSEICVSTAKKVYLQNNIDFFVCKVKYTQLFSFSFTQFLSLLANGVGVNLGGRGALIGKG